MTIKNNISVYMHVYICVWGYVRICTCMLLMIDLFIYSSVLSLLSLHLFFPPPSALFLPRYIRWPFSTISPLSLSILRPSLVGGLYSLHLASEQLSPRSHLLHRRRLWQLSRLQNFLLCRRSVEVFASYVAVSILIQIKELLQTFICSTQIVVI